MCLYATHSPMLCPVPSDGNCQRSHVTEWLNATHISVCVGMHAMSCASMQHKHIHSDYQPNLCGASASRFLIWSILCTPSVAPGSACERQRDNHDVLARLLLAVDIVIPVGCFSPISKVAAFVNSLCRLRRCLSLAWKQVELASWRTARQDSHPSNRLRKLFVFQIMCLNRKAKEKFLRWAVQR
jgi:hypothetical protein